MYKETLRIIYLTITLWTLISTTVHAQLTGTIIDSETGDSIPYASVSYKGHRIAVSAKANGTYSIQRHNGWKLTFSAVGYKPHVEYITEKTKEHNLDVLLIPDTKQLSEVLIKSKKSKYSRKDNPAVEFMRRVIAAKKKTDLRQKDFYSYTKYDKVKFAFNNINPLNTESKFFNNKPWLREQVEICGLNGRFILPILMEEKVTQELYRKDPSAEKSIVLGEKSQGINEFFETGDIVNVMLNDVFSPIDIYEDQVRLLRQRFTSPIGKDAIAFYRFYLTDTLIVDRDTCIQLSFIPNNQQDFGFRGELYVVKDSTLRVKRVKIGIPRSSAVNHVDNMDIVQEFGAAENGEWVLKANDMFIELSFIGGLGEMAVISNSRHYDHNFAPIDPKKLKGKVKEVVDARAELQDDTFWSYHRGGQTLTKGESHIGSFIDGMKHIKGFGWGVWVLKAFVENFIETSPTGKPSYFDIGPVNTLVSQNEMDGLRMRIGGQTTANLCPHLFYKGYFAHGFNTKREYYNATFTYSFNRKKYLPAEFPRRNIVLESSYDICSPSDRFVHTDKDNMFTSFKWSKSSKMMFYNTQKLSFVREELNGLKFEGYLKTEENEATGGLFFKTLDTYDVPYDGKTWENYYAFDEHSLHNGKMRITEVQLSVQFSPGAKYFNTKQRQLPVNREAPVFTVSHTMGIKGLLGGQFHYNTTEAKIFKRFFLNSWGILNCYVNGGIQWSQVPYPLLMAPATNLSFFNTSAETFNLIDNSEFMNDRYASLNLSWELNGKIFNRIPIIKKLKWREFLAIKSLWGGLSAKNNPANPENWTSNVLMAFPEGYYIMDPNTPYVEGAAGIHNIFKFFSVDYVHRFNYINHPGVSKNGIRFAFKFTF